MDSRTRRVTEVVKRMDRNLFAIRAGNGMIQIHRNAEKYSAADFLVAPTSLTPFPQLVLCLTHDWKIAGKPVEWGLDPLISKLSSMDSWRDDSIYEELTKDRDRIEKIQKQSNKNELEALACDIRKDFAKETNDINTSTLEKVDFRRRKENGTS